MQKLLCKIYWSSTNMRIPQFMYSNPAHLGQWLDCFLHVLSSPVQEADVRSPFWKVCAWTNQPHVPLHTAHLQGRMEHTVHGLVRHPQGVKRVPWGGQSCSPRGSSWAQVCDSNTQVRERHLCVLSCS